MVSLRRYWAGTEDGQRRALDLMIHGVVDSAVCINPPEYRTFSEKITALAAAVPPGCGGDELLVLSASTVEALRDYNSGVSGEIKGRSAEFQLMMDMLAHTMMTISGGSAKATESLEGLRRDLESAALMEDVRKVKTCLGDCLRTIREEVQRQKSEADKVLADLQRQIERGSRTAPRGWDEDAVTGLPMRESAEESIRQAAIIPGRKYLVTAVLDRLQSLNARFGREFADRVLRVLTVRMKERFEPSDVLFRWTGPSIVALIRREESIDQVRQSVRRIFDSPFTEEFEIGGREVLVPVSAGWSVIGLVPPASVAFSHIDRFVASLTPRDYC